MRLKIVRVSDFNPAFTENVHPLCRLINDASQWMEYCAEQNPKTTRCGCKGRRAKKSPIRRLVCWEQPAQHRKSFNPHGSRPQGSISLRAPRLCQTVQVERVVWRVPASAFSEATQWRQERWTATDGRLRTARRMQKRSSSSWIGRARMRWKEFVWSTSTSSSPTASGRRLGVDC